MAAEGEVRTSEIKSHEQGYSLFVRMMTWGAILSFIAAMVVLFMISS